MVDWLRQWILVSNRHSLFLSTRTAWSTASPDSQCKSWISISLARLPTNYSDLGTPRLAWTFSRWTYREVVITAWADIRGGGVSVVLRRSNSSKIWAWSCQIAWWAFWRAITRASTTSICTWLASWRTTCRTVRSVQRWLAWSASSSAGSSTVIVSGTRTPDRSTALPQVGREKECLLETEKLFPISNWSNFTEQLAEIKKVTLARLLCDNGDYIEYMQPLALILPRYWWNKKVSCQRYSKVARLEVSKFFSQFLRFSNSPASRFPAPAVSLSRKCACCLGRPTRAERSELEALNSWTDHLGPPFTQHHNEIDSYGHKPLFALSLLVRRFRQRNKCVQIITLVSQKFSIKHPEWFQVAFIAIECFLELQ